jgi:hypothetical protein
MNKRQRKRREKKANKEAQAAKLKIMLTKAESANDKPAKETGNKQGNTEALKEQPMSRWLRFKKWLFTVTVAELVTVLLTASIAGTTIYYTIYSKKQWQISRDALQISQRAYVTIGRKDGVMGDFIVPKDPKQGAEIVIYFTNNGHLPAKFAWGTMAGFLAEGSEKNSTGITYTHPYKGGLAYRTRDKKNGSIGQKGDDSTIIPGDSVFVSTLGTISQKDLAQLPQNHMGLLIMGVFDYCDELGGRSTQHFDITYRSNAPVSNMSFALIDQTNWFMFPLPKPTATTEYLPPCETIAEREQN